MRLTTHSTGDVQLDIVSDELSFSISIMRKDDVLTAHVKRNGLNIRELFIERDKPDVWESLEFLMRVLLGHWPDFMCDGCLNCALKEIEIRQGDFA